MYNIHIYFVNQVISSIKIIVYSGWYTCYTLTNEVTYQYSHDILTIFFLYYINFFRFKNQIKIVHFIGAIKPWHHPYNTVTRTVTTLPETYHSQEFLQYWWDIFIESVHPHLDPLVVGLAIQGLQIGMFFQLIPTVNSELFWIMMTTVRWVGVAGGRRICDVVNCLWDANCIALCKFFKKIIQLNSTVPS